MLNDIGTKTDSELGEYVLMVIDKEDDLKKVEIIGKLFNALVLSLITRDEFNRFIYAVQNIFVDDIEILLKPFEQLPFVEPQRTQALYSHELLNLPLEIIDEGPSDRNEGNGKKYCISEIGCNFVSVVFDKKIEYKEYLRNEIYEKLGID